MKEDAIGQKKCKSHAQQSGTEESVSGTISDKGAGGDFRLASSTFYAHYNYRDQLVKEVLWESVQEAFAGRAQQWSLPLENGGVQRRFIRDYLQRFLNDPTIRRFCTCRERGNYLPLLIRAHVDLTLG